MYPIHMIITYTNRFQNKLHDPAYVTRGLGNFYFIKIKKVKLIPSFGPLFVSVIVLLSTSTKKSDEVANHYLRTLSTHARKFPMTIKQLSFAGLSQ